VKIEVLTICRRPPRWVTEQTDDYLKRLPREFLPSFVHLAPGHDGAAVAVRQRDEATRLLKRAHKNSPVVALDEHGWAGTSIEFAARLDNLRSTTGHLTFIMGGAEGLHDSVLQHAHSRWSLSKLTLPHLLVQIVLAEQLYRAWSIHERHPDHRA